MKKITTLFLIFIVLFTQAQKLPTNIYQSEFDAAYQQYPNVPRGVLEAVSYTMTRFQHLTNTPESCTGIPKTYGVMGLTLDGKNYFNNNLNYISQVSGISINDILTSPAQNILAFAAAYNHQLTLLSPFKYQEQNIAHILTQLSELPNDNVKQDFALNSHLYSVLSFMNDVKMQEAYHFSNPNYDLEIVFGQTNLSVLKSAKVTMNNQHVEGEGNNTYQQSNLSKKSTDYPPAIEDLTTCNFSSRNGTPISAVTVHTIQGTYAGAISWAHNCTVPANVSYHYVLRSSDGQVTQVVLESDKAWHVGSENPYTIGMEHEGYVDDPVWYTTEMYQSSADVVRDITQSGYGINPLRTVYFPWAPTTNYNSAGIPGSCVKIKGHQHYPNQTHTDPGANWDWDYYYKLINAPTTSTTTNTNSSGTTYDSGGSTGNYGNDERTLFLIQPTNAQSITLTVNQFDVESTWDYLYIYEGTSVYGNRIGIYTGTTIPSTINVNNSAVLIEFRSDCASTNPGYSISWDAVTADAVSPSTSVSAPTNWVTSNFTANFTDTDNSGGSGIQKSYYQVIDFDGTEWRANANNGFFADNFDVAIHPEWDTIVGNWTINTNALYQSNEAASNTNISAYLNQSLSNRYLYQIKAKIDGSGTTRRAGFHFFADSDTLTNRGNSYFVWFRVDDAKLQIYKVVNDVFGSPVVDMPFTTVAGQLYDYKIIYDRILGKIILYRNDTFITSWTDSSPIATGDYISFRTGNANMSVTELKVYRSRYPSVTVTVGPNGDIRYQNPNPSTPSGKIKSIVDDNANNISTIAQELVNVDWTPPTNYQINDGVALDIDTTYVNTQLDANWNTATDINSGVVSYSYAIGTTPGDSDVVGWTNNGLNTTFNASSLSLTNLQDYYTSVRSVNAAGLDTAVVSNGVWVVITTGINNIENTNFLVYPNPFNNELLVQTSETGKVQIKFTDITGRLIFDKPFQASGGKIRIDLTSYQLPSGNYHIQLNNETISLIKN
ncbi:MAG: N-acetylmuramoyl-L-alanine amidase [Flavobacteriales bacterium]|nr:N-acetylmuramoyl-L-alanine amidase [Flavobacteriales bacterium]MCB9365244.1 N-acetylmuramoyl-L-alanine amidase [Flavobacteriales bacterium]